MLYRRQKDERDIYVSLGTAETGPGCYNDYDYRLQRFGAKRRRSQDVGGG